MSRGRNFDPEIHDKVPDEYRKHSTPLSAPLPKDLAYEKALADYLDYIPTHLIAATYHIPQTQLLKWINEPHDDKAPWSEIREEISKEFKTSYFSTKSSRVHELVSLNMVALRRVLMRLIKKKNLTTKDAHTLAQTLELLDKVTRLDEGKSTSNIAVAMKPASLDEIRDVIQRSDPFLSNAKAIEAKVVSVDTDEKIETAEKSEQLSTVRRNSKEPK